MFCHKKKSVDATKAAYKILLWLIWYSTLYADISNFISLTYFVKEVNSSSTKAALKFIDSLTKGGLTHWPLEGGTMIFKIIFKLIM